MDTFDIKDCDSAWTHQSVLSLRKCIYRSHHTHVKHSNSLSLVLNPMNLN